VLQDPVKESATGISGANVTYSASAKDTVDGDVSVSCDPASGSLFGIGTTPVTCSAQDSRGNQATPKSFDVQVVYDLGGGTGEFANQDSPPAENTVGGGKAGAAIQVRFSLGGDFGLEDIFEAGYPTSKSIACKDTDDDTPADDTLVAESNSGLKYDSATNEYVYVWKTDKAWNGTCRQLTLKLKDGTEHTLYFKFLK
jgi:hypothetical protein